MAWHLSAAGLVAPATYASSGAGNTLDEVEYGTYSPIIAAAGAINCDHQTGNYMIVGRMCHLNATWRRNQSSVPSGVGTWQSMPFTTNTELTQVTGASWSDSGNDEGHKGPWAIWGNTTTAAWLYGSTQANISRYCYIYDTDNTANGMENRDHLHAGFSYIVKASH